MGLKKILFGKGNAPKERNIEVESSELKGEISSVVLGTTWAKKDVTGICLMDEQDNEKIYLALPYTDNNLEVGQIIVCKYNPAKDIFNYENNFYKEMTNYEILKERRKPGDEGYSWGDSVVQSI